MLHFQDQIAEVLRLPAVFTVSPVGEVLTGNRAVRYAEICHSSRPATALQAQPQSIYRYLDQHAWNPEAVFSWKGMRITVREILNGLLQDLKQELSVTVYGNCDTCVACSPIDGSPCAGGGQSGRGDSRVFRDTGTGLCIGRGLEVCKGLEQRRVFSEHHVGCGACRSRTCRIWRWSRRTVKRCGADAFW